MADTVVFQTTAAATPPDATIIATDDAGAAGQVQIIKLAISTDGSATVIPADAANGLDVDVTRVGGTVAVTQSGTWDEVGINDSGNSITVDGTVAATQSGTWNVGTVTAVTGITNPVAVTDNDTTLSIDDGAGSITVDGADDGSFRIAYDKLSGEAYEVTTVTDDGNYLPVEVKNSSAISVSVGTVSLGESSSTIGTVSITGDQSIHVQGYDSSGDTYTTIAVDTAGNTKVVGEVADDSADSGNPVKVGGKAKAFDGTDPGSVSEDDRVHFITDLNRRQYVNTVHPMFWTAVENNSSAQTNNAIKAAPGAGLSLYITDIIISTDAANNAKIVEDTGGTPATLAGPYYFAANGGAGLHFVTPIKATANKDIGYTTVGASNCTVEIHGFTAP